MDTMNETTICFIYLYLYILQDCFIGIAVDPGEITLKDMDEMDGTELWRTAPKAKQSA